MSKFKFGNSLVRIEIEDMIFHVTISQELRQKIIASSQKLKEIQKKCETMTDAEKENTAIPVFDTAIDDILGKGVSAKIFGKRFPDIYERIAVYIFICDEINKQCYEIRAKTNEGTV